MIIYRIDFCIMFTFGNKIENKEIINDIVARAKFVSLLRSSDPFISIQLCARSSYTG